MTDYAKLIVSASSEKYAKSIAEHREREKTLIAKIEELTGALDVALAISDARPKAQKISVAKEYDAEATAVAVASDWHVEETVDKRTVNGLNEFNLNIAEQRINAFFRNVARMTQIQRQGAKIDRLVLVLGGDLMTGTIHEELLESNGLSPTQTVLWLQDRIASGVKFLEQHFSEIVIPCVYGNHGRNTKKPRISTGAANSYEWMLYHILAKHLPGDWHIADGQHLLLDVYGKTLRVHHGDALKYQGGIGGITIPVEKAIASWDKAIRADLDIFGHWHQSQQNPKWICNGSLIGFNAYSIRIKASYEPPSQTFFLLDKRYGRTVTSPIFLQ